MDPRGRNEKRQQGWRGGGTPQLAAAEKVYFTMRANDASRSTLAEFAELKRYDRFDLESTIANVKDHYIHACIARHCTRSLIGHEIDLLTR